MARLKRTARKHPFRMAFAAFVIVGIGFVGRFAYQTWQAFRPVHVDFTVPAAPQLQPHSPNEVVYRIDAGHSKATYSVPESLAGTDHTATGTTSGIEGDILVDSVDATQTQVGQIVVNVEQFTSDQSLRDNRIR